MFPACEHQLPSPKNVTETPEWCALLQLKMQDKDAFYN